MNPALAGGSGRGGRGSRALAAVGVSLCWSLAACGGSDAAATLPTSPAVDAPAAEHEDTAVVTSEVPAESTDMAQLRDLAYNLTPEEFLASLSQDDIDEVGGEACALELASISLAISRYAVDHQGVPPASLDAIAADPALADLQLWTMNDTTIEAADGSGCNGPYPVL